MKICFVMLTPFTLGGSQRVVSVMSNILNSMRHSVSIICTDLKIKEDYEIYNLNKKIKILHIEKYNFFNKINKIIIKVFRYLNRRIGIFKYSYKIYKFLLCDNKLKKNLIEIVNQHKFDVVIGVGREYSFILASISRELNCKIVGWQHSSFDVYFNTKNIIHINEHKMVQKLFEKFDRYIVLTNYDKIKIKEAFNYDCQVIYNPKSFESEKVSGLASKNFLAGGRLVYEKGIDMLLDSFKYFSNYNKDWNLTIVGAGKEEFNIMNKIKEYNISDRVQLVGMTKDIKKYFIESSCLLLPSRWEGMPMIVLESLTCGVPVISYNISAMQEIIDNYNCGIMIEKFDIEKYAKEMIKIASDYDYRKELGENARKRSKDFSHDTIAKQWEDMLDKLNIIKGKK